MEILKQKRVNVAPAIMMWFDAFTNVQSLTFCSMSQYMNKDCIYPPSAVVMVRPHCFTPNPQTAADNKFQVEIREREKEEIAKRAYDQVTNAAHILSEKGISVHLFEDTTNDTPDSVFPNNWFSTHHDGTLITYPMYAENRRLERRKDIIDTLNNSFNVLRYIDYSLYENECLFLEGTGAMVLDCQQRIAYAVNSHRADRKLLHKFCNDMAFEPFMFEACDETGQPIYHTNVMMCIASNFAMVGLDMMTDAAQRNMLAGQLRASGRKVISLDAHQIKNFAGNAFELRAKADTNILAISQNAYDSLSDEQKSIIEETAEIIAIDVSAIELAGGSLRCMLAAIYLHAK